MANSAAGAAAVSAPTQAGGGGAQNPFQIATNLYAEQNVQGQFSGAVPASATQQGGSVNAGQYLRGVRLIQRTTVLGVIGTATAPTVFDQPFSVIQNADIVNVDGSEILYNMTGFAHSRIVKYGRPWLQDPDSAYDTAVNVSTPVLSMSHTLFLQPEIRFTAGVLANTDTRSQYRLDYTLAPAVGATSPWSAGGAYGTTPSISVLPYMDAWAQPDGNDLQGTANQPVPPGVNLQNKRRHQIFTMNANGSDNIFLSTLTGNAIRLLVGITRNASGARVDGLSTANGPFYWQLDNRSLGKLSPDIIRQWAADFYDCLNISGFGSSVSVGFANAAAASSYNPGSATNGAVDALPNTAGSYTGAGSADVGVYVFPRWIEPGELTGQGWLYSANSTKLQYESNTTNSATTLELISDEIYPVGPVDPTLIDI